MKTVLKPFGQVETPEARAVRQVIATRGYAQSIELIEYVDSKGHVLAYKNGPQVAPQRAVAERYTLTDAGSALHDEILAGSTG